MIEFEEINDNPINIKVIGAGGGGNNAINNMVSKGLQGVQFVAANTDAQVLANSLADVKLQIGTKLTRGLGAGADPERGRGAALEDAKKISELLEGTHMVFVTAGMGGGTGTGAAPVIANIAKEMGILTVGVVTKPFRFEGKRRRKVAEEGIKVLKNCVDTLIVLPNDRLLTISDEKTSMKDCFTMADNILLHAVQSICDIINLEGHINVDFADVQTVMSNRGLALMGTGISEGEKKVLDATQKAIASPLLEDVSIEGARGILINIMGNSSLSLHEVNEAVSLVEEAAHDDATIIFGYVVNEAMGESVKVTVIATGFGQPSESAVAVDMEPTSMRVPLPQPTFAEPMMPNVHVAMAAQKRPAARVDTRVNLEQLPLWDATVAGVPEVKWPPQNQRLSRSPEEVDYEIPTFLRQRVD